MSGKKMYVSSFHGERLSLCNSIKTFFLRGGIFGERTEQPVQKSSPRMMLFSPLEVSGMYFFCDNGKKINPEWGTEINPPIVITIVRLG